MTDWQQWKDEEKLSLINEIKQNGHVLETCSKYGLDPLMFYRQKEIYDTYGVNGPRSGTRHSELGIRNLKKEIERLKKMLAEKELGYLCFGKHIKGRRYGDHNE